MKAEGTAVAAGPDRRERVRAMLAQEGADCLIAAGPQAVNHLAGYWSYFGSPAAVVLERDGAMSLVVARDEAPRAEREVPASQVRPYGSRGFGLVPDQSPLLARALAGVPAVAGAARVCLCSQVAGLEALLREALSAPLQEAAAQVQAIRLVKDAEELRRIRAAYELAWAAQGAVAGRLDAGASEIELFSAAMAAAQVRAGQPIEFLGDLLGGARSADVCAPISIAGTRPIAKGEAIVSDLVVGLRGYWGDTAETYGDGGDGEVRAVRGRLREILGDCAAMLRPRATGAEVHASMSAAIAESFPGGEFPHHGGHGVGLGSYEEPHVIPGDEMPMQEGMVIALEPGVYFAGRFGARVEEMFVVSPEGGRELRSLPPDVRP